MGVVDWLMNWFSLKVGLYSSPHVRAVNERLHLTGGVGPPVSTEQLEECIQRAR